MLEARCADDQKWFEAYFKFYCFYCCFLLIGYFWLSFRPVDWWCISNSANSTLIFMLSNSRHRIFHWLYDKTWSLPRTAYFRNAIAILPNDQLINQLAASICLHNVCTVCKPTNATEHTHVNPPPTWTFTFRWICNLNRVQRLTIAGSIYLCCTIKCCGVPLPNKSICNPFWANEGERETARVLLSFFLIYHSISYRAWLSPALMCSYTFSAGPLIGPNNR